MSINNTVWKEGLSKTSIGRFGGYYKDYYMNEKGFLCLNATADTISVNSERKKDILGRFRLSSDAITERYADWTTVKYLFKCEKNGKLETRATAYQSVLSPGILYDVKDNNFIWQYDRSCQMMRNFYLTKKISTVTTSSYSFNEKIDGEFEKPWMFSFFSSTWGADTPLLFIFQHKPVKIVSVNNDYKKFFFKGSAGRVVIMPLFGVDKLPRDKVKTWTEKIPGAVIKQCDYWAQVLQAYPAGCREEYTVDMKKNVVVIKNTFKYITGENDWGISPLYVAPVPPIISQAKFYGYPVNFREKMFNTKLPTRIGDYTVAYSKSVTYEIPCCSYADHTILPVKVKNDPKFEGLNRKLGDYLNDPVLTFGGDWTYNRSNIQDVLHNFRVLAWATWSLDEKERKKVIEKLSADLKNMNMDNYDIETEPVSQKTYLKEKKIWSVNGGEISFDYEWYNGMQLAGLWSYYYYGNKKEAADFIKKKWNIVEGLSNYYRIFNDWATGTFWTDAVGEHLWMDGFHYGWQGLVCLIRLARITGNKSTEQEAEYLTAKSTLARWCCWYLQEYAGKHKDICIYWGARRAKKKVDIEKKISEELAVTGFVERHGLVLDSFYNQGGFISYLVPELFLLYLDYPEIVEKLRIGQNKLLPRNVPDWNTRIKYVFNMFKDREMHHKILTKQEYTNQALAWHHFYFLDSLLFTRALILREPWEKLKSHTTHLTGPVMEAYLVGTHPLVVFPVGIDFLGNEWDEKAKTLTIKWSSNENKNAVIKIYSKQKPTKITGLDKWSYDKKSGVVKGTWKAEYEGEIIVIF